jgi:flagellar biosynthetic protein FliR
LEQLLDAPGYFLIFVRVASILWLIPLFAVRNVSTYFKVAFSLVVTFLLMEVVPPPSVPIDEPYLFLLVVGREALLGMTIGFSIRVLFAGIQAAGEMVSIQTGFSFARIMDPFSGNQVGILDQFQYLLALMVFFSVDGHHLIIRGLADSYRQLPLGTPGVSKGLIDYIITSTGSIFSLGLKIGAPVIVALLLIELSLGLLSRMMPQMNIFVEGLPVKVFLALTILSLSLSFIVPTIAGVFSGIGTEFGRVLRLMVPHV